MTRIETKKGTTKRGTMKRRTRSSTQSTPRVSVSSSSYFWFFQIILILQVLLSHLPQGGSPSRIMVDADILVDQTGGKIINTEGVLYAFDFDCAPLGQLTTLRFHQVATAESATFWVNWADQSGIQKIGPLANVQLDETILFQHAYESTGLYHGISFTVAFGNYFSAETVEFELPLNIMEDACVMEATSQPTITAEPTATPVPTPSATDSVVSSLSKEISAATTYSAMASSSLTCLMTMTICLCNIFFLG